MSPIELGRFFGFVTVYIELSYLAALLMSQNLFTDISNRLGSSSSSQMSYVYYLNPPNLRYWFETSTVDKEVEIPGAATVS